MDILSVFCSQCLTTELDEYLKVDTLCACEAGD